MSPEAIAAAAELPPKPVSHLWPGPAVTYNNMLVFKLRGEGGRGWSARRARTTISKVHSRWNHFHYA